jgi:hypothetical protein
MRSVVALALGVTASCGRLGFDAICLPGYAVAGSGCYRVDSTEIPWLDAEQACEADAVGAHLAAIEDAGDNATVAGLLVTAGITDAWIGTTDVAATGNWRTVTGSAAFLNFDVGEPGDPGIEHCLYIINNTKVHDEDCDMPNDFVCQFDGVPADHTVF